MLVVVVCPKLRDNVIKKYEGSVFVVPLNDKDLKSAVERVSHLAVELYDLMENGMTIDFTLPERTAVTAGGKHSKSNRLIVTKPGVHLALAPNSKENDGCSLSKRHGRNK